LEPEALSCPFCGALYRELIPSGTVQMKCKYCGGAIVVPAYFSGEVRRCSNHPDVLAVGLCNDCGSNFCEACLYFYDVEHGTLHLCPNCYKDREAKRALGGVFAGVFMLLFAFFFLAIDSGKGGGLFVGALFGIIGVGFVAYGIMKRSYVPVGQTLLRRRELFESDLEFRGSLGSQAPTVELYNALLADSLRNYGPKLAMNMLERELDNYEQGGLTRGEAVRRLAREKGY